MTEEKIIEMFRLMWDNVPGLVRLIRKDRTVVAVNRTAMLLGYPTGVRCIDVPPLEGHRGCRAGEALAEQVAKLDSPRSGQVRFWIPLTDELYVHFSIMDGGSGWDFKSVPFPGLNAK